MDELITRNNKANRPNAISICEVLVDENLSARTGKVFGVVGPSLATKRAVSIMASCVVAPVGSSITGRLLINGTAITSSTFTIGAGQNVSNTVALDQILALGDRLSIEITQVGSSTAGQGLTAVIEIQ
jgi:hypothetical protein